MEEQQQQQQPDVDPRFVRNFVLGMWKRVQEKEYFEERKKYRQWWWDHTAVLLWKCITWSHATLLFLGTFSIAKALFWIRINWFLLSVVAQSTCLYGQQIDIQCFNETNKREHSSIIIMTECKNLTTPLVTRYLMPLLYDPYYLYSWIPESLEIAVVGPIALFAYHYRDYTLWLTQLFPWLSLTGVLCFK